MLTIDGKIAVDFVGRFENLQKDFNHVCTVIKRPLVKLPHAQKTDHRPYQEYYDKVTKAIVEDRYACDIDTFGYCFKDTQ